MYGAKKRNVPVFILWRRRHIYISESVPTAAEKDTSAYRPLWLRISDLPLVRSCVWFPEQNSTQTSKYNMSRPATTHNAV